MRNYEIMIILDPEVDDRQVQGVIDNHLVPVTAGGGVVTNIDIMGRRRFAYEIKKKAEGTYVVVNLEAEPAIVKELDRRLSIDEKVLRAKVFRPEAD
ncbi:MAG: 30S ribosomal protein S6 [Propionibacteriaceae bacterium]|jgi:small subunit ribosomal protein S6|nr:30S ribosomal protein S6 [Propionibacteriaceae bacterium]